MNISNCAAVFAVVSALDAVPVQASQSVNGRWAIDPSSCSLFDGTAAQSPLIVTDSALRWSPHACRIERVYKIGDTVHIQAMCSGEGSAKSIPVSLRPHSGRLTVTWDRGARGDLQRCP